MKLLTIEKDLEILTKISEPVKLDENYFQLITELKEYVLKNNGLGMSAVQFGVLRRIFVMRYPWDSDKIKVAINPQVIFCSIETEEMEEGCFSVPNKLIKVARPKVIYAKFYPGDIQRTLEGIDARIFLHEYCHLNGGLITKHDKS